MAVVLALALFIPVPAACAARPVPGSVVAPFAPGPGFGGHWGVDIAAPAGSVVRAMLPGTVSFSGRVVDNLAVTVDHSGGLRTTYSYLSSVAVGSGAPVEVGAPLGTSGSAHGIPGLHVSVRIGDRYVDPVALWACAAVPGGAVRLVSDPPRDPLYAVRRAARHPGRNLRPFPRGPSDGRGSSAPLARPRRGHVHHRRRSLPEARGAPL